MLLVSEREGGDARRRSTQLTFAGYEAAGQIRGSVTRSPTNCTTRWTQRAAERLPELLLPKATLVDTEGRAARRLPVPKAAGQAEREDRELLDRLADARPGRPRPGRGPAVPRLAAPRLAPAARLDPRRPGAAARPTPGGRRGRLGGGRPREEHPVPPRPAGDGTAGTQE
ncbi:hypothetical protein ACFQ9Z_35990 [Streptomyces sp. NPDC056580]|uniref:nSTAND1 domain-containing NTPase n=1 Tax=Streptomyces sp. NPDC056580 TaxID=3345872 RepID=UPI00368249E4